VCISAIGDCRGFQKELENLINKYSIENESNTPDFILALYVRLCLSAFNDAVSKREAWYGHSHRPGSLDTDNIRNTLVQDFADRLQDNQ
jgi:hypothetical protein